MTIPLLGLILWVGAHLFKRLMPEARAQLGTAGRGAVALTLVVALALIIWGYRGAEFVPVWSPPAFLTHLNNLLMLLAFWTFGSSAAKGRQGVAREQDPASATHGGEELGPPPPPGGVALLPAGLIAVAHDPRADGGALAW